MKLIDDLKAAAKKCVEQGSCVDHAELSAMMNLLDEDFVLLLCEAVEASEELWGLTEWDAFSAQAKACKRVEAVIDKLRSYAP